MIRGRRGTEARCELRRDYSKPATATEVYVNGDAHSGNPADIQLTDKKEIAIVIGAPPSLSRKEFPK